MKPMLKRALQQKEQKPIDWPVPLTDSEKEYIQRSMRSQIQQNWIFPNDAINTAIIIAKKLRLDEDFENELQQML
jgi:hypothetical protein